MGKLEDRIMSIVLASLQKNYENTFQGQDIIISKTRKDISADFSLVLFPLAKKLSVSPKEIADKLSNDLLSAGFISNVEFLKGFLNITIKAREWLFFLDDLSKSAISQYVRQTQGSKILIEFSSPNTNKPQHLGHIRNNLLGDALSRMLSEIGHDVKRLNLINNRGIHICKSMLAWKKWGNGITPEKAGKKGDHLVGDFYVLFEQKYKEQVEDLVKQGVNENEAKKEAPLLKEAQEMLRQWEHGDPDVIKIWETMNDWVIKGFEQTYKELGITFDKIYLESDTYLLGKQIIKEQLEKGVALKDKDGSVYIDLTDEGLDRKILLRSDGTSVYITQDIGNAVLRYSEFKFDKHYYVVADEQIYHFKVLRSTLKKFGYTWWNRIVHFSYGMVELPEGKMKSREGKVVDADDLIDEMYQTAREKAEESGKLEGVDVKERDKIIKQIGLAALKFYILNVDPKRTVLFVPQKSIDFQGKTGPFVQYSYARIRSIFRKAQEQGINLRVELPDNVKFDDKELSLIKDIYFYPQVILKAAEQMNPSLISNFVYNLAKDFNSYYHDYPILRAQPDVRAFRLLLADNIARVIKHALSLLGIEAPERM